MPIIFYPIADLLVAAISGVILFFLGFAFHYSWKEWSKATLGALVFFPVNFVFSFYVLALPARFHIAAPTSEMRRDRELVCLVIVLQLAYIFVAAFFLRSRQVKNENAF